MTTLISTQSLQLETPSGLLFDDLSFTLKLGDRIGLIGHNGCGKSTLLGLLSGRQEATRGSIQIARQCSLQHVEQHLPASLASQTLYDALHMAIDADPGQQWRVDCLIAELGFDPETAHVPVNALSGGQHTRLLLGRALLHNPNLLLLDEPSNHLDLPSLLWLEQFLQGWKGAFVLVSHDQRLLDTVTQHSWILRDKQLYCFDQPCSPAMVALEEADGAAVARFAAEQKEIDRLAASSHRLAIWGRTYDNEGLARKAQSMQKRVEKLKATQSFVSDGSPWQLSLQGQILPAKLLLGIEALAVRATPDLPVLFNAKEVWLKPGDHVALLGANGSGKSSLLRQCWQDLLHDRDHDGRYYHPAVVAGYYDQSLQQLHDEDDLMAALYAFSPQVDVLRRQALISAGFPYQRHGQLVATLSGGERARLLFLGLSLARYHLLLLDEPTNHLDMAGKQQLADALAGFDGGFILVSHDRAFIEQCCSSFWVVSDGNLQRYLDADNAYQQLLGPPLGHQGSSGSAIVGQALPENRDGAVLQDDEQLLARLISLEDALAADLARKPRQQRPHVQQQWRAEIQQLSQQLGMVSC
ncbi:ABC-F family ATP-binding cassette domain-containing protein [Chitinimonas sp. BJB300]|uniref:ABC-F family ATP-binding cassette domain-containing protein n=1 Tax=Chitinimonas sp. BJB300 TaxID=1559339 RepID=UPI000C0FC49B|nr:ABC-F family ATP-binding cassette domain-containing protein [Chitinimonas sp. BJB300]PHV13044.1 ABC transporter [Chitinimonas sp. BJB300]TSJ87746.1 ABC-F family ATP-binding cassette domain-containing protein [Chitinimonas sp. BJB300]